MVKNTGCSSHKTNIQANTNSHKVKVNYFLKKGRKVTRTEVGLENLDMWEAFMSLFQRLRRRHDELIQYDFLQSSSL